MHDNRNIWFYHILHRALPDNHCLDFITRFPGMVDECYSIFQLSLHSKPSWNTLKYKISRISYHLKNMLWEHRLHDPEPVKLWVVGARTALLHQHSPGIPGCRVHRHKVHKKHIHYSDHRWTVIKHVVSRLFIPGYKGGGHDYDPDKPETWQDGLHYTQLALLFLKRCTLRGGRSTHHQNTPKSSSTTTCLPVDLRKLVLEIWGGVGEFRDYRDVGSNVRKAWYKHYDGMRDTRPLPGS